MFFNTKSPGIKTNGTQISATGMRGGALGWLRGSGVGLGGVSGRVRPVFLHWGRLQVRLPSIRRVVRWAPAAEQTLGGAIHRRPRPQLMGRGMLDVDRRPGIAWAHITSRDFPGGSQEAYSGPFASIWLAAADS